MGLLRTVYDIIMRFLGKKKDTYRVDEYGNIISEGKRRAFPFLSFQSCSATG